MQVTPSTLKSPLILIPGHVMIVDIYCNLKIPPSFWIYFDSVRYNFRESFKVVHHAVTGGYITLHGFDQGLYYALWLRLSYILRLPRAHVVMLSFPYFHLGIIHIPVKTFDYLELWYCAEHNKWKKIWRKHGSAGIKPDIYDTSLLFKFRSTHTKSTRGFKCLYTFLLPTEAPDKLSGGVFNCTRHYTKFRHHLDCNLRVECHHKEDETGTCPFSSPRCNGLFYLQVSISFIFKSEKKWCMSVILMIVCDR